MRTFKDNAGREWIVEVNVESIKRVRALAHVDLLEAVEGTLLERLSEDPILLCETVYALVQPAADERQVSDVQFGRAMAGDAIELATVALLGELADFFPSRKRRVLQKALAKIDQLNELVTRRIEAQIDSGQMEARLERELARLGLSFGAAPESSDSTRAPSPSAN